MIRVERTPQFECLFCRAKDRSAFTRIEHAIPESLGNDDFVLPAGFVCDVCNQYFGSKIERRILEAPPFNIERTAYAVPTKKGKLARYIDDDFVLASSGSANTLLVISKGDHERAWRAISRGWIVPKEPPGYDVLLARFCLKVGLELLLGGEESDPYSGSYDAARRCARYGDRASEWDVGWGIYPRRTDLLVSTRVDEVGTLHTHQIYQYEMGIMPSGDVVLCFVFSQSIFACNLNRPPIMEYLLGFNTRNEFSLKSRWTRTVRK